MSGRKYKPTQLVRNLAEFEKCKATWYEVTYDKHKKMWHRGALESLQTHTLMTMLYGDHIYACEKVEEKENEI